MKSARAVRAASAENIVFSFSLNMQIRNVLVAVAIVDSKPLCDPRLAGVWSTGISLAEF